eukprot:COSAG01_NODE_73676_length_239_cov_4.964286_1_plen_20_part_10
MRGSEVTDEEVAYFRKNMLE